MEKVILTAYNKAFERMEGHLLLETKDTNTTDEDDAYNT